MKVLSSHDARLCLIGHFESVMSGSPRSHTHRMANALLVPGKPSSITNEANLIGGENVGGAEAPAAPEAASDDGDGGGDGESDPDRRRKHRNKPSSPVDNFDRAPDSQLLDLAAIKQLTCKSRATIYRWIEQGILPQPRKFGPTRNFWTAGEIRRALSI